MTIQRSDQLNELFSALSKLQGKLDHAKKDKAGYNNRYKYADLPQYIEISKELLAEHGLCILQIPETIEIIEITRELEDKKNNSVSFHTIKIPKQKVTTYIGHSSGQFISGTMEIIVERVTGNSWGQSTGSAISFSRKYAFAGTLCMSQEDDDNQIHKKDTTKYASNITYTDEKQKNHNDPLTMQLMNLIRDSGCDVGEFTKFHTISSRDMFTIKKSIDNFDELLINFRDSRIKHGKEGEPV